VHAFTTFLKRMTLSPPLLLLSRPLLLRELTRLPQPTWEYITCACYYNIFETYDSFTTTAAAVQAFAAA
jgi:hypothetical protein